MRITKKVRIWICIIVVIAVVMAGILGIAKVVQSSSTPKRGYTIVIDAGHGGRDNGCSGVTSGVAESEINLQVAKKLQTILTNYGFNVVMTRENANGLYDENATNYKTSDMAKRIDIIRHANTDFVISIHCNSYPNSSQMGIQAFYQEDDEPSKALADAIQSTFITQIPNARKNSNFGDYFILKEAKSHAVLVECGYLTNPEEDTLLNNADYQNKIAYAITCGIIRYFGNCNY